MNYQKLTSLALSLALGASMTTTPALGAAMQAPDTSSSSETADAQLTQVTQSVKNLLAIPDDYTEFFGEPEENLLGTSWRLTWGGEDKSLSISATSTGKILSLNRHENQPSSNDSNSFGPAFPKMTREQARPYAQKFLDKVFSSNETAEFDTETSAGSLSADAYNFRGSIRINGKKSPLRFQIRVRLEDGLVTYFWRDDTSEYIGVIPEPNSATTDAVAAGLLKTTLSMKLEYVRDGKDKQAVLRYLPEDGDQYYVDANGQLINLTELKKKLSMDYLGGMSGGGATNSMAAPEAAADQSERKELQLSKTELEGIAKLENVLSQEELDQAARKWKELGLDGFELIRCDFSVDREDSSVSARLSYAKKMEEDNVARRYVTLDAKTGALERFSGYDPYDQNAEPTLSKEAAQTSAETFLKAVWPEEFGTMELYDFDLAEKGSVDFQFTYAQKVNGYFFPDNQIDISINGQTGAVSFLSKDFDKDVTFESPDGIVSMETALDTWAASYPVELSYLAIPVQISLQEAELPLVKQQYQSMLAAGYQYYYGLRPGYALGEREKSYSGVNAKSGELAEVKYSREDTISYNDLGNHWAANALQELASYNVGWTGGQAKPDQAVTQYDYLVLLASADGRSFSVSNESDAESVADEVYRYAYQRGLLTKEQRNDTKELTRGEIVQLLLDSLGYRSVAKLQGIYRNDFTDGATIPQELLGYASLAQGLHIINGDAEGKFAADRSASRAEAAFMLWQYLKR